MPIPKDIIPHQTAQVRAGVYGLFARLFREAPSMELLQEIVKYHLFTPLDHGLTGLTMITQKTEDSARLGLVEDPHWPQQAEAIGIEFARLFAVPGEHAIQPYESVYCDSLTIDASTPPPAGRPEGPLAPPAGLPRGWSEGCRRQPPSGGGATACSPYFANEPSMPGVKGFLGGPSITSVRQAYQQAGFELDPAFHDLPDALSVELEFLGRLIQLGREKEAGQFFTEHVGRWVFRCLDDLQQKSTLGFYRAVGDALAAFLRRETRLLG